jgi:hypothetical protein
MYRRRRRLGLSGIALFVLVLLVGVAAWSLFQRTRQPGPAPPEELDLAIEVMNGCGSPGAADRVASLLRRKGFRVEHVGNADHFHYREDIVAARTVSLAEAEPLARALGGAVVVEQRIAGHEHQVTVVVGTPRSLIPGSED